MHDNTRQNEEYQEIEFSDKNTAESDHLGQTLREDASDQTEDDMENETEDNYRKELDDQTKEFLFGTWKLKKLGFADSFTNPEDFKEVKKIDGDELVIEKTLFSSEGLKEYKAYQYKINDPQYYNTSKYTTMLDFFQYSRIDLNRLDPNLEIETEIMDMYIYDGKRTLPFVFFVIDQKRLLLLTDSTIFELERVEN